MSYAIVDIETTGGHASANGITEIAIVLHNGREVEGKFHTLINPGIPIPPYISTLTGITNQMLYGQPAFEKVAEQIFNLLQGRIFVAHNVNFDYSFIKHQLTQCGLDLNTRKLCTVRLSRKVFPGYLKYNLGAICRELDINLENAHRAYGDAQATTLLFEKLMQADSNGHISAMLKGKNKEQYLPMHVPAEQIDQLPSLPGVYYFHNKAGKIVYVGKATCIISRVKSHFSNNDSSKRKQDFLKNIHTISHKVCGNELMALVLENVEIRRLWPEYNRSQKSFNHTYGLYSFTGQHGYRMLAIEKKKNRLAPLYTFNSLQEGFNLLKKLIKDFDLHAGLCFIDTSKDWKVDEDPVLYNQRVAQAIEGLHKQLPTFALVDASCHSNDEQACLLMEQGRFYGMGYLPDNFPVDDIAALKTTLTQYPDSDYIRALILNHASKYPASMVALA